MTDKPSWFMRQRRRFARFLMQFSGDAPAGAIAPDDRLFIDDGLDYLMPIVVPDWWPDDKKREAVEASMREHGWTNKQITEAVTKRRAAIDEALKQLQERIDAEADPDKKQRLIETSAPFQDQFSSPNAWERNIPAWPTQDPLREWDSAGPLGTTSTRREILMRTHLAMERNPVAKTAVHITTLFAMGDGLTLKCYNPDVEHVLEDFRTNPENDVEGYEKAFCDTLQVDGELFIRFYTDRNGQTVINPLKPWEIWWIETERGFPRRPVSYHWYSLQTNYKPGDLQIVIEDIPADEVLHITINRFAYEQRGRPDLFSILPWLKAYKDWLENRARQNFWRGALLWWVKLINGQPGQVSNKRAQYRQPPPPGSIVVTNDKEEWSVLDNKVNASDASDDGRNIKLMSAIGKGLPEYMLSDGQNANLASASAQQLPALRTFGEYQDIMVNQVWKPIYKRVLQNALAAGLLPAQVQEHDSDGEPMFEEPDDPIEDMNNPTPAPSVQKPKMISLFDAYDLEAPELESDDPKTLAESLQIAQANEWISGETAAGRLGYDYMSEQKKIEREKKAAMQAAYQGAANPPLANEPIPNQPQEPITPPQQPETESAREDMLLIVREAMQAVSSAHSSPPAPLPLNINVPDTLAIDEHVRDMLKETRSSIDTRITEALNDMNITVNVPEIKIPPIVIPEQPAPVVNISPAEITVNVPEIKIPPAVIENKIEVPASEPATLNVVRNNKGQIVKIEKA